MRQTPTSSSKTNTFGGLIGLQGRDLRKSESSMIESMSIGFGLSVLRNWRIRFNCSLAHANDFAAPLNSFDRPICSNSRREPRIAVIPQLALAPTYLCASVSISLEVPI